MVGNEKQSDFSPAIATKRVKNPGQKQEVKPWKWTGLDQTSFDKLKTILISPHLLAYPDFTKPFAIHTDALHIESTKCLNDHILTACYHIYRDYSSYLY